MYKKLTQIPISTLIVWAVLTLPLVWLTYGFVILHTGGGLVFDWSGVFSVWLMLAALAVTPMIRLFRTAPWNRWLVKIRRHIGVASFGYGLLHTVYWVQLKPFQEVLASIYRPVTLVGWLALAIFIAMAVTSNDWSVRRMGPGWKVLQRSIYLGAPLVIWHWLIAAEYRLERTLGYVVILAVLMGYRLWQYLSRRRRDLTSQDPPKSGK